MARRNRPKVATNCVADRYAADNERIIEFIDAETNQGGLISFRRTSEGNLRVDVYRCDEKVEVMGPNLKRHPYTSEAS